jgi:hypothetical protein
MLEMAAVDDQYPVQQLAVYSTDPSLGDRIRSRRADRGAQDTDALAGEHGVEGVGELAVTITDQEREPSDAVAEVRQDVAGLLSNPGSVRVRRNSQEAHAAGGVLDHEQHI